MRWAEQMEVVVLAWFVLIETDSAFLLGIFASLRFTGTLFAPLYGIAVDRYDRRTILTLSRAGFGIVALLTLVLTLTDSLEVWHVFVLVGVTGMGRAFDNITRQSILPDVVERDTLVNAVALTRTGQDITQIFAPVIGGVVLSSLGMESAFTLIVIAYVTGTFFVYLLEPPTRTPTIGVSVWRSLLEAGSYIKRQDVVLALLLMAFLVNFTALPLNHGLMPVFARDVLGTGATGLGVLLGAYSAGAFIGSAVIAFIPQLRVPGRIILFASLAWHGSLFLFAQSNWFGSSLGILAITGLVQSFTMVTMTILLLGVTTPELRGRVMGVRSFAVYGLPMGLLLSGAAADAYGAPAALMLNGAIGIGFTGLIALRIQGLWGVRETAMQAR